MSLSDGLPELLTRWILRSGIVMGIFLLFPGCTTPVTYSPDIAPEYVVVRGYAPFYKLGPMQPGGPNGSLPIDTRVKLLRREMGYSLVQLDDDRTGYVPDENMAPAPARPLISSESGEQASSGRSGRHGKPNSPRYNGNQVNDTPLPDPAVPPPDLNVAPEEVPYIAPTPAPTEKPKFRY